MATIEVGSRLATVLGELAEALIRDNGFSFDPAAGELVAVGDRTGWAVARAGSERLVDPRDLDGFADAVAIVTAEAERSGALVGGWHSRERNAYMVEVTDVHHVDRATALVIGMTADQETVMNLRTGEVAVVPQWGRDG